MIADKPARPTTVAARSRVQKERELNEIRADLEAMEAKVDK